MIPAILIIILLFIGFAGADLLAFLKGIGTKDDERAVRKLLRNPHPLFEEKRRLMEPVLLLHIDFYRQLPPPLKVKFLYRCASFMLRKRFIGKEDLEITEEMKILISAAAVQLTFGLKDFYLKHFHTIIVYPGVYTSPLTGADHLGETSIKGLIVLSWQHFLEGYETTSDKLNLGLHEMAHALDLSRMVKASDPFFHDYFLKWHAVAGDTINEVNQEEEHFLRKYSGTNEREFFAVCVEHFFEDPDGFRNNLPHLYRHLSVLLRQDPVSVGKMQHTRLSWVSNQPEGVKENVHQPAHFQSSFPYWFASKNVLLPIVIFSFIAAVSSGEALRFSELFLTGWFLFGSMLFFVRYRMVEVVDDYVVVRSPVLAHLTQSFAIDNIISIRYDPDQSGTLHFTALQEGQIITERFGIGMVRKEYDSFKMAMTNKNVLMSH